MRFILKSLDWFIAKLNTHILVDGNSQKNFLVLQGVVNTTKACVLGDGSISGVNIVRFNPSVDIRVAVRKELNITDDKVVFVFMGRLNHDKGLYELLPHSTVWLKLIRMFSYSSLEWMKRILLLHLDSITI